MSTRRIFAYGMRRIAAEGNRRVNVGTYEYAAAFAASFTRSPRLMPDDYRYLDG